MIRDKEQNLAVLWGNSVLRFGDRECLRFTRDGEWSRLTYRDTDARVRDFALGLLALGFTTVDSLALLSENRAEWAIADLATLSAGGITVPIYATNTPEQIGHILKDVASRFLVVSNHYQLEKILSSKEIARGVEHIVIADPIPDLTDKDPRVRSFADVEALGKGFEQPSELDRRGDRLTPEHVATIIYTSGTTGAAKGAALTHGNLLSNIRAARQMFQINASDLSLSVLPLSHSLERTAGHFAMLSAGAAIAYAESIKNLEIDLQGGSPDDPDRGAARFRKLQARIRRAAAAKGMAGEHVFEWALDAGGQTAAYRLRGKRPPAYLELQESLADRLVSRRIRDNLGGRIRFMVSGGAPLARETAAFFVALGVPVYEGYGLTGNEPGHFRQRAGRGPARNGGPADRRRRGPHRRGRGNSRARAEHHEGLSQSARGNSAGSSTRDGSKPATSAPSTATATSPSPTAKRTSSLRPAERTSRRSRSKRCCRWSRASRRRAFLATGARTSPR
ncbi:MAG: AMP-binding protein [Deltaproteobacteria bacterium]|nr:AMP-binding protein [Deltaproteobacteria bacterium]